MRLIIDMQGAQSNGSRNRGIGRYTLALAKEMVRQRGSHRVVLALNGAFADTIEHLKAEFAGLLTADDIFVWFPPTPTHFADPSNGPRREAAEAIYEAFLASLNPDVILLTSLFEGLVDDAVTSIGGFETSIPKAVILYDLIPLIQRDIYPANPDTARWYHCKLDQLRRADMLLSISASSGREAVDHLGFPQAQVVNISTACNDEFRPAKVAPSRRAEMKRRYGITKPYVMYTGGIDHRKNIEGLIRAFGLLPKAVRSKHQLAIVCAAHDPDKARLMDVARDVGLAEGELVMTGFVADDDLLTLYNGCALFVFPSWHEGFGLPALEAMACGRPTIGSNTSSLPEVIGLDTAMFDPHDDQAIAVLMAKAITDDAFRKALEQHAVKQARKFSWKQTAKTAWRAIVRLPAKAASQSIGKTDGRLKLAFISPLPTARSGIADYSVELLPELSRYYDIDVIVAQDQPVVDPWVLANARIRSVDWFKENSSRFDRVIYHFGNSDYHSHMFDLLNAVPGVVVLHDFFLSGIVAHMDVTGIARGCWPRALLADHGWHAAKARFEAEDTADVVLAYPCNGDVLRCSRGVIVHAQHSAGLAQKWFSMDAAKDWSIIPHLRVPVVFCSPETREKARAEARRRVGMAPNDFVVCSFGHLGQTKLNHKLLESWTATGLASDQKNHLIFVGQNDAGQYGQLLEQQINQTDGNVSITGFLDTEEYRRWLVAADIAVQLRSNSRGETSGAVLDCWNHSIATIVNAHGGLKDLPQDATLTISDEFSTLELADALSLLRKDHQLRARIGANGHNQILINQNPRECAAQYNEAIEKHYSTVGSPSYTLQSFLLAKGGLSVQVALDVAGSISKSLPPRPRLTQWLVDVSELARVDSKSGIQRVVRAVLLQLLNNPPSGVSVRPVFATNDSLGYRYADTFTAKFLDIDESWCEDSPVEAWHGDIFFALDLQLEVLPYQQGQLQHLRTAGIKTLAVVYDLLPITLPDTFVEGAADGYGKWLEAVEGLDGALCISKAVADELIEWLNTHGRQARKSPFEIHHFPLGADIDKSVPTRGLPSDAEELLIKISGSQTFLAVGTIEPRKEHQLILEAFEHLWGKDRDYLFVIVGKQGWLVERLIERIRSHPEFGRRLIWLEDISDEFLGEIYRGCNCLIAASRGEGFGLPIIEAAIHSKPVIARDITVFREVGGEWATFFPFNASAGQLAQIIDKAASQADRPNRKSSKRPPQFTWQACANAIKAILAGQQEPYTLWPMAESRPSPIPRGSGRASKPKSKE